MHTNTHAVHRLLDNLAGYSSEDGLEDACLSADFKLDILEIPSYKAHLYSEYKCYHKCPNVMRHLPHCGFTSVVYSYLLIWCPPPPPKLDAQCRVHQFLFSTCIHTKWTATEEKYLLIISSSVKNNARLFPLIRISTFLMPFYKSCSFFFPHN